MIWKAFVRTARPSFYVPCSRKNICTTREITWLKRLTDSSFSLEELSRTGTLLDNPTAATPTPSDDGLLMLDRSLLSEISAAPPPASFMFFSKSVWTQTTKEGVHAQAPIFDPSVFRERVLAWEALRISHEKITDDFERNWKSRCARRTNPWGPGIQPLFFLNKNNNNTVLYFLPFWVNKEARPSETKSSQKLVRVLS